VSGKGCGRTTVDGLAIDEKESMGSIEHKIGDSPLIATAIHDGHALREEMEQICALDDLGRLREEDPFTGQWTNATDNRVIVRTSRFEVDLNRVRKRAVYIKPEDAWGLKVWKKEPTQAVIKRSLDVFDSFYAEMFKMFSELKRRHGKFVVFDLHTYNHLREGPGGQPADPAQNPEVNIGTGTMKSRKNWENIINRFIKDLKNFDYLGRSLDVRENIKFFGGQLARWTHGKFPESACVLSIEFKKFFMDEWSGRPDEKQVQMITDALSSTVPGVLEELKKYA